MNWLHQREPVVLSWPQRICLVAAGTGLVALLAIATRLEPDARGFGTHQQLGLPPCTFRQLTGMRCPSCGMTTAWSHLVRGRVGRSFRANAGGAVLGIASLLLAPWALASGVAGRWLGRPLGSWAAGALAVFVVVVTLVDWIVRCFVLC